jgi:RHS repeat-associated protein
VVVVPSTHWGTSNWVWFGYDPLGRCVKRWVGLDGTATSNPATYLYYDGWNLVQEGSSASNPSRLYVHGARVDEVVAQIVPNGNVVRYSHYDARGHCTLQTDALGSITEQYEYDAFGYPYFYDAAGNRTTVNGRPDSPWGNRFLFTGREWLSDLRLYDYRARMYQPELGRFLQPDPKQFEAGDYNLYRYCHNDPVNKNDPMGLDESVFRWLSTAGPIELTKTGNWGDKTAPGFYQSGLSADGKPASAVTDAAMLSNSPQDNGGVKVNIKVDTKVDPVIKGTDIEKVEMDHPNGFKDALIGGKGLPTLNSQVQTMMAADKHSYNSMKQFAEGRARTIQRIFKTEKNRQEVWHLKNGRHDLGGKFFGK